MSLHTPSPSPEKDVNGTKNGHKEKDMAKKRGKMSPEQKKKLEELEKERRKAMDARIAMLTLKLTERLRPYVEAQHPGEKDDPETMAFETKMRREADDLKLESFGLEVCEVFLLPVLVSKGLPILMIAPTRHRHGLHHESVVIFEITEVLGNVCLPLSL
jgi:hypothetical protein